MTIARHPGEIAVYCGTFASQQLAFAHLLDWSDKAGFVADLDQVEVIPLAHGTTRLAHYFDPETTGSIRAAAANADTVILVTDPDGFPATGSAHLDYLGRFPGTLVRARPDTPC